MTTLATNFPGNMLTGGDILRREGYRVLLYLERNLMFTEVVFQPLFALHGALLLAS